MFSVCICCISYVSHVPGTCHSFKELSMDCGSSSSSSDSWYARLNFRCPEHDARIGYSGLNETADTKSKGTKSKSVLIETDLPHTNIPSWLGDIISLGCISFPPSLIVEMSNNRISPF